MNARLTCVNHVMGDVSLQQPMPKAAKKALTPQTGLRKHQNVTLTVPEPPHCRTGRGRGGKIGIGKAAKQV